MLLKLYNDNPNPKQVERVVTALLEGGLIIYPTDSVYAMGCDALNVRAVERICRLKGLNPDKNRLSIICADLSQVSACCKLNNNTFKLMRQLLPGAYTFILETSSGLPRIYKNRHTVGIRIPDNNILQQIILALGNPLLTASLKVEDEENGVYMTDPELIEERYGDRVDIVVDGGIGGAEPTTIIDCTGAQPLLVRQGKGLWGE